MMLKFYCWCRRFFMFRWKWAYLIFASLTFRQIRKVYGPQSNNAWEWD